jgi:hypothetical protein
MANINKIRNVLKQLVGFEFTRTTRATNMECFKFGIFYQLDRKGIQRQVGEFDIHLQCPWRITKDDTILVGSDDLTEQPDETAKYDENFDWDVQGGNLRDIKLEKFLNSDKYVVESVVVDNFGGFELFFNNNTRLTVFPTLSCKSEYSEYWRLLDHRDENKNHFVVGSLGIDE